MAVELRKFEELQATLGTTVTRVHGLGDVRTVWVNADADLYLSYDNSKDDGDAIHATSRYRIPVGTSHPIRIGPGIPRPVVAAVTGSATAWFLAEP